jgi:hypothetical protein
MALVGAFLFGSSYGALHAEHRWRGNGLVPNLLSIILDGLIAVGMMSGMWGLTALRLRIAALFWRKRS